jgi:hypothetical protein
MKAVLLLQEYFYTVGKEKIDTYIIYMKTTPES